MSTKIGIVQVDVSEFALSVLVTQRNGSVETFVLGDTQECHTYDLRLARFHLLYQPWVQGPAAVSGMDRQVSSRENLAEPRQMSRSISNLRSGGAGGLARAASSQPGVDPSSGLDLPDLVSHLPGRNNGPIRYMPSISLDLLLQAAPALIYLQDLHEAGVLHTGDGGAEYSSRLEDIEQLTPAKRREALRIPLVHLASAPVNHHAAKNDWAAHLPKDHLSHPALEAAFCVQVCAGPC